MSDMDALPGSLHFQLQQLADGVYAAIAKPGGGSRANAGIVDLGDCTLLFDATLTSLAARDLCAAAEELTGRPVTVAVNSHWHADHVFGNQALPPGIDLISTARTRELIAENIPERIEANRSFIPEIEQEQQAFQKRLEQEQDPDKRQEIAEEFAFNAIMLDVIPTLTLRLPNRTFERRLVLHGAARTAELLTFGGGHTESDAILVLPEERIVFVGDLLFHGSHPWLGHGDPDEWLRILDDIDALEPETVVPGHGEVATPAAFDAIRAYIPALWKLAVDLVEGGASADELAAAPVPEPFAGLPGEPTYQNNMRFLHERLSGV